MKKILLALFLLQQVVNAKDINQFCSNNIPKKTFSGNIASISGVNFLSRNIIESAVTKAIKKEVGTNFKIALKNFYGTNILNGEFKSLQAKGKHLTLDGVNFSDIEVKTMCSYNKIGFEDDGIIFFEPMLLEYRANITQEDLDKYIKSEEFKKTQFSKLNDFNIKIKKEKLSINFSIPTLGGFLKPVKISLGANLKVENGKIVLSDVDSKPLKRAGFSALLPLINSYDLTNQKIDIDKNQKGNLEVKTVKIADSKIQIEGLIKIPRS